MSVVWYVCAVVCLPCVCMCVLYGVFECCVFISVLHGVFVWCFCMML